MTAEILEFDVEFDATEMSAVEIRDTAREKGWPGINLDTTEYPEKLTARRLSERYVYGY